MRWIGLVWIVLVPVAIAANASIIYPNGTLVDQVFYDRAGLIFNSSYATTYGANAYIDQSPTNPNMLLSLCHPDLEVGDRIDLRFVSESGNLSWSVLNFKPQVAEVTFSAGEYCSTVDFDLSSIYSLYPGYLTPFIIRMNATNETIISDYDRMDTFLNGSFRMGIEVRGPPKEYFITIDSIYDENGIEINRNERQMVTSILAPNGTIIEEGILSKDDFLLFDGSFQGGERIYVNGMLSLEVLVYEPCDPLNESGYYILNKSLNNYNESCIRIEDASNIVLNFVGEQIDGDNDPLGSRAPERCPVDVRNSRSITFENLRTSEYRYGICVSNSTVNVFGDAAVYHDTGARITNGSDVLLVETLMHFNDAQDINATGGSHVRLYEVNFSTAMINSSFKDSIVRPVPDPPPPPNITGILDIEQWIRYDRTSDDAWAQISFKYPDPLPNEAAIDNVSLFRYNGTDVIVTQGNDTGLEWVNGTWIQLFTLVAPQVSLIIGPNLTEYSVFAPYAFNASAVIPDPDPEPQPQPQPQAGTGTGAGGTPSAPVDIPEVEVFPEIVELELELPDNVTLRQGEIGDVDFNLTNVGGTSALNISIETDVPREWDIENFTLAELAAGQRIEDSFLISPDIRAIPREYFLPVNVYVDSADGTERFRVLRDVLRVIVLPRGDLYRLRVIEYPPVIRMPPHTRQDVSFLIENIGDNYLDDITIRFDETPCLTDISGSGSLDVGERSALTYTFRSADTNVCEYLLRFEDTEGRLVGFVPVTFLIQDRAFLDRPLSFSILLIILTAWTILTVWIVRRRRY